MKIKQSYKGESGQVEWLGYTIDDLEEFSTELNSTVLSRVDDTEMMESLEADLRALAQTDFDVGQIELLLASDTKEDRDWAIGEAIAEVLLEKYCSAVWPWNGSRDKKTPKASLPGADLVGLVIEDGTHRLLFGEVKTSADIGAPPHVMYGRSGMIHQLDTLATKINELFQIIKWLYPRCKGHRYESEFMAAVEVFIKSGLKDVRLYGVLVRDTTAAVKDLSGRGESLAEVIKTPSTLKLHAYYLPCKISELKSKMASGGGE